MNLSKFINALETRQNEYKAHIKLNYFDSYKVVATEGKKYFKILRKEIKDGKEIGQNYLVCFVNKENGDILKAASWALPAKHARGNILSDQNGMEAFRPDGYIHYLK